jgi:uncharacterized protein (TIGR02145 family)
MNPKQFLFNAILVLMSVGQILMAQTFRTAGSGNWTSLGTWEQDNGSWVAATSFPGQTSTDAVVTIQAGHQVSINPGYDIIIDDINVEATGKLTVLTGGKISINEEMGLAGSTEAAIVVNNEPSTGTIATLNCGGATLNGSLYKGMAASNVTVNVPYTGGNGGTHFGQTVESTGVTGLFAVLVSGTFASGGGTLTYTIIGTPLEAGNAVFALEVGGKNCNLTVTVAAAWPRDTLTVVVDVTNPVTGKTWMDRNLGASRAATSSTDVEAYGDLYQWGRAADGHESRTSGTRSTVSSSNTPGHSDFITGNTDWRSPQNDDLWQGVSGTNNPCPSGYRLPTEAEWNAERASWSSNNNSFGAFASPLKLPVAGSRSSFNGSLYNVGSYGFYWSANVDGAYARFLSFFSSVAAMDSFYRPFGYSVRCLKDDTSD